MSEWKETTLSDICSDISYGYTASANVDTVGPKFLRITDIVPDRINWNTVPYCEADELNIEKYKLQEGDIVIARTGATTGYNKIIKNIGFDVVFASYLIRYKIDVNMAYPYYIGHILQSSNWYNYVDAIAGGSAQPGANAKQLGSFEILLPPLPEQRAIASVLSSLDDKIDLLHRQNKTLEAMAETLFRQWFVEGADEGWGDGVLGDVIELFDHLRIPLSKMERDKKKDGRLYPYYGAAKIMDYINEYIFDGDYILLGEDGTVRTNEGYPVLQYATGKFWVNNHTHVIKAKPPYNNFFLWNYLSKKNIDEIITGAVQPKINQGNLKALDFPKFPDGLVIEFNEQTEPFFKKMNQNQSQIRTLKKLSDTLLPKLMSGEVRVEMEASL
jgi:type I restriction enzyme S subunit